MRFGTICRVRCRSSSLRRRAKFYVIDAYQVARDTGMGSRMNTIMQVCFFAISKVLPRDQAIEAIRKSIRDTYGKQGRRDRAEEHESRGRNSGALVRSESPGRTQQHDRDAATVLALSTGVRARRAGRDLRGTRRRIARQRISRRRHFPHRHREMGEAQPGARNPRLGFEDLHPVRQVRHGVSALGHPHQGLRLERTARRARNFQIDGEPRQRMARPQVHDSSCAGRLHRLRHLRRSLSGQEQEPKRG